MKEITIISVTPNAVEKINKLYPGSARLHKDIEGMLFIKLNASYEPDVICAKSGVSYRGRITV